MADGVMVIDTGEVRIEVKDRDGNQRGVVKFNPGDVVFAETFYALVRTFEKKISEYQVRYNILDKNKDVDENKLPVNMEHRIGLMREVCEYIKGEIDRVFGAGTSQASFGDAMTLAMFNQFFDGISPHMKDARGRKTAKYDLNKGGKSNKVMD